MHYIMKLSQTYWAVLALDKVAFSATCRNIALRCKGREEREVANAHINDTIMIFRSDAVLFDSEFAKMDAANGARHHIGIIGL